jgi:hypothetical protein
MEVYRYMNLYAVLLVDSCHMLNTECLCDVFNCRSVLVQQNRGLGYLYLLFHTFNSFPLVPEFSAFYGNGKLITMLGRAIAQAVSPWLPTAAAQVRSRGLVKWDLWWTKWRWGRIYPSTSVSPANLHSTNCSTITLTYHLGLVQ